MTTFDAQIASAVSERAESVALVDAPNRDTFFSGEPLRLTWAQVDAAVDAVAFSLQEAGVTAGHAVAIQLPNCAELPISILACTRIGAIATPFPIQHREHELRHGLSTSGARHLITGARPDRPDLRDASAAVLAEFDATMLTFGSDHPDPDRRLDLDSGGAPAPHIAVPTDTATICWTSGTTGTPKGVPRSHAMWLATSGFQVAELELGPDDRILCPFPVVNMAGIGGMLVPWIETASRLVLHNPIDLGVFLGQIATEQITYTVAPPPLLNMLLRNDTMLE
ncbi:MAG: acyl--CoA ligase, partial [Acidimicrobiales bacterium]|nr:acyl--CoA ligase [Acidimicrobiales bacterium]